MEAGTSVTPEQDAWLREQSGRWVDDGLLDAPTAEAIRARYVVAPRRTVGGAAALVVTLGGLLVAVGVVLLVAANVDYDRLSPLSRFLGIAVVWLGAVAAAEAGVPRSPVLAPLRGPLRALAVAAYGATIFQAAQSLQVPAYDLGLVLAWSAGSMAYAYAVTSAGALTLAIGAAVSWYALVLGDRVDTGTALVLGLALPVPLLLAVAMAHAGTPVAGLAPPWRGLAALLALGGLFLGAIPSVAGEEGVPGLALAAAALGVLGCGALAARGDRDDRLEAAVAVGVAVGALLLVAVAPTDTTGVFSGDRPPGSQVAFSLLGIAVFVSAAIGVAVLGVRRDAPGIADLAATALFGFVVLQAFGFLAPLASGAALVLLLGIVLVAGGVLVDRGRRVVRAEAGG